MGKREKSPLTVAPECMFLLPLNWDLSFFSSFTFFFPLADFFLHVRCFIIFFNGNSNKQLPFHALFFLPIAQPRADTRYFGMIGV